MNRSHEHPPGECCHGDIALLESLWTDVVASSVGGAVDHLEKLADLLRAQVRQEAPAGYVVALRDADRCLGYVRGLVGRVQGLTPHGTIPDCPECPRPEGQTLRACWCGHLEDSHVGAWCLGCEDRNAEAHDFPDGFVVVTEPAHAFGSEMLAS